MKTLVVEDDFVSRLVLQKLLQQHGPVDVAVNGDEALFAVRAALDAQEAYNLICLDIMMPGMDGQKALTEIRGIEASYGVPAGDRSKIFMVTALDDIKNVFQAFHSLCDAYLQKPVNLLKLNEQLRKFSLIA